MILKVLTKILLLMNILNAILTRNTVVIMLGIFKNDEDDDFKLFRGFGDRRTNRRTDICDCRVAFATENISHL